MRVANEETKYIRERGTALQVFRLDEQRSKTLGTGVDGTITVYQMGGAHDYAAVLGNKLPWEGELLGRGPDLEAIRKHAGTYATSEKVAEIIEAKNALAAMRPALNKYQENAVALYATKGLEPPRAVIEAFGACHDDESALRTVRALIENLNEVRTSLEDDAAPHP